MKHTYSHCFSTVALSIIIGAVAYAQSQQSDVVIGDAVSAGSLRPEHFSWKWTTEQWTGSDVPFAKIRQEVKEVRTKGNLNKAYLKKLEEAANQRSDDAETQFRWGYAMLEAPYAGINLKSGPYSDYYSVVRALGRPKSPHSYLYARLRFVLMSLEYEYAPLKNLGIRLLNRNPEDTPVKTYLISYLSDLGDVEERKLALKYAQQLVSKYPRWAGAYSILGSYYQTSFLRYDEIDAANKSIAAYQKFISLLPKSDQAQRVRTLQAIKIIEREKEKQQKKGDNN